MIIIICISQNNPNSIHWNLTLNVFNRKFQLAHKKILHLYIIMHYHCVALYFDQNKSKLLKIQLTIWQIIFFELVLMFQTGR